MILQTRRETLDSNHGKSQRMIYIHSEFGREDEDKERELIWEDDDEEDEEERRKKEVTVTF